MDIGSDSRPPDRHPCVALSPVDSQCAYSPSSGGLYLRVFMDDPSFDRTNYISAILDQSEAPPRQISWSPGGDYLAAISRTDLVIFCNLRNRQKVTPCKTVSATSIAHLNIFDERNPPASSVNAFSRIAFSRSGDFLAVASIHDDGARISVFLNMRSWSIDHWRPIFWCKPSSQIPSKLANPQVHLAVSSDGNCMAYLDMAYGDIYIIHVQSYSTPLNNQCYRAVCHEHIIHYSGQIFPSHFEFSDDGPHLETSFGRYCISGPTDQTDTNYQPSPIMHIDLDGWIHDTDENRLCWVPERYRLRRGDETQTPLKFSSNGSRLVFMTPEDKLIYIIRHRDAKNHFPSRSEHLMIKALCIVLTRSTEVESRISTTSRRLSQDSDPLSSTDNSDEDFVSWDM